MRMIPYGRQSVDESDIEAVVSVLRSDFLTTGPKVAEFEVELCATTGAKYAVAMNSGTSALYLAALALLKPDEKVLTTPNSFVATSNAILYAKAKPIFVDIEENGLIDLNICEDMLRKNSSIKALFPVHFSGLPIDSSALKLFREKYGVRIVEDCAHSLGASGGGKCENSDASILSFHPVKHITTGEGGSVTTNDEKLYKKIKHLVTHGITREPSEFINLDMAFDTDGTQNPWYYEQQSFGYNYRISDISCALGLSQLSRLDAFVARRREIARKYEAWLETRDFAKPLYVYNEKSSYHRFVALFDFGLLGISKPEFFVRMREAGIGLQVHYIPINAQPYYRSLGYTPSDTPGAQVYYESAVSLPMYATLSDEEFDRVTSTIDRICL